MIVADLPPKEPQTQSATERGRKIMTMMILMMMMMMMMIITMMMIRMMMTMLMIFDYIFCRNILIEAPL